MLRHSLLRLLGCSSLLAYCLHVTGDDTESKHGEVMCPMLNCPSWPRLGLKSFLQDHAENPESTHSVTTFRNIADMTHFQRPLTSAGHLFSCISLLLPAYFLIILLHSSPIDISHRLQHHAVPWANKEE